jgi:hypothetical protein
MAKTAYIDCIDKEPRIDPYDRIRHVGGRGEGGWKITSQQAIHHIESGEWEFYTRPPVGHGQKVIVASRLNRKYLKTQADYDTPDNLLSLPQCPY